MKSIFSVQINYSLGLEFSQVVAPFDDQFSIEKDARYNLLVSNEISFNRMLLMFESTGKNALSSW